MAQPVSLGSIRETAKVRALPDRARTLTLRAVGDPHGITAVSQRAHAPRGHIALGGLLVERGLITSEQLDSAVAEQKKTGRRLGHVLVDQGLVSAEALLEVLSEQLGVPTVRINAYTVSLEAIASLPEKVARRHTAFPLRKTGSTLVVALPTPKDLTALDDLRFASGCEIHTVLALEDEIVAALNRYYRDEWLPDAGAEQANAVVLDSPSTQLLARDEAAERSAVAMLERVIARAAADTASDIHFEPRQDDFHIRFRVDGVFREVAVLPLALAPAVVARVKVLSGMDIAEHRLPQDGRFSATVGEQRLDLRSSTYPTVHGEKAVLRLLDSARLRLLLDRIGMNGTTLDTMRELIHRPEGILLITGPTGSGKTSTLYAALGELVQTGRNIVTIEDPVEYSLPGVNQGQTNDKAGFTFARGLRAILRQDPDVVMVGEIRDVETLEVAIEGSLTGHLVLSTLHTNGAVATIARLMEMGLEPYLLASSVLGIVAQRLVRRICDTCRTQVTTPAALRSMFREGEPASYFRGAGCPDCRGTGFRGRAAIFELLRITEPMCELVLGRGSGAQLNELARREGMRTLREECLSLVERGETTLEEVLRVTQERRQHARTGE
ncbi:MAG: Flp pilus assembly complex ATPase component TadA [Acidobacteria bacterium]|nr:Flp pilus assembly complex ATPase component TadA [Acidobacteriota bacterium]